MPERSFTIKQVLIALADTPPRIAALTAGLVPAQLHAAPSPGEWSANDVLAHLRSCADMWGNCITVIIAEDRPTIRAINPRTWIKRTDYLELKFQPSLRAYATQRADLLTVLKPLAPEVWSRSATVTGAGKVLVRTVLSYADWLAHHERPHIKQIARIVKAVQVKQQPPREQVVRQCHWHVTKRNTMDKIDLHQGMTLPQVFYTEWKRYQDQIKEAIAPLTADQLRLRAAPTLRPVGENVAHIIATRVGWFNDYMRENDPHIAPLRSWDDPDVPQLERSAAELVAGMDRSWQFMQDRLDRWTSADLAQAFPHDDPEWRDSHVTSRSWVVWHVLEHDLHHGGEVSLTLGLHGLHAPEL